MPLPHLSYQDSVLFAAAWGLVSTSFRSNASQSALLTFTPPIQAGHFILNRYEPKTPLSPILLLLLLLVPNVPAIFLHQHITSRRIALLTSNIIYYLALATSAALYRLSPLHPLHDYPGPWISRVTSLYACWVSASGKPYVILRELHEKYGDFVRIGVYRCIRGYFTCLMRICACAGPNDISVRNKDAIPCILGTDGMGKGFSA